jgi:hypothetical protein
MVRQAQQPTDAARTPVVAFTFALFCSMAFTTSKWPWYAARCSGARPSFVFVTRGARVSDTRSWSCRSAVRLP